MSCRSWWRGAVVLAVFILARSAPAQDDHLFNDALRAWERASIK